MGTRTNKDGETIRTPTTKAEYREEIIASMNVGLRDARWWAEIGNPVPHGLVPQAGLYPRYKTCSARKWAVAQQMEREGLVKVGSGSWESGEVVIIAGENWPEPLSTPRFVTTAPDDTWRGLWAVHPYNPDSYILSKFDREARRDRRAAQAIKAKLVAIGGWAVQVTEPAVAPFIERYGQTFSGEGALFRPGEPNSCHANAEGFAKANPNLAHWIGFALTDDGMWRSHSWLVGAGGQIIETTAMRIAYHGAAVPKSIDQPNEQ